MSAGQFVGDLFLITLIRIDDILDSFIFKNIEDILESDCAETYK